MIAIWFAGFMLSVMLPFPLRMMLLAARIGLNFIWFFVWLFLLIKTYQGDRVMLPVLGSLAQAQAEKPI